MGDFEDDEDLMAVLAERLIEPEPMVSRSAYALQPLAILEGDSKTEAECKFFIYGGA
jgi:putative ATP-dependent endonuclease of OLD family